MTTPRKPTPPTTTAIDQFCAQLDDLFCRRAERAALRSYLIGLLLPREHNKTLTVLASVVPGTHRQRLHHFLHDAPWEAEALNVRRLQLWQAHPQLAPHPDGVLIIDETGDRKRSHVMDFAAQQYIGKLGHTATGVVSVTSHWTDGTRHVPVGVKPYCPACRLPQGKKDPAFRTKPELAWDLIEAARAAGLPFRVVVADCMYGENPALEARLFAATIPYVLALRASHGTWQVVADEENPPAFTPKEAAHRLPAEQWQRHGRRDSHGKELVHYVAELELGAAYGPTAGSGVRLIAATDDLATLPDDTTWYLATSLPADTVSATQVYELYCLRDWIEHYYKPAKHELGWADYQTRQGRAIVRHWHLVMLAFTFSLLTGAPAPLALADVTAAGAGGKISTPDRVAEHAAPRAQLACSVGTSPPVLAALDQRAAPTRTGRSTGACGPLAATRSPNLTNQR
jgi:SRSO17 transposase